MNLDNHILHTLQTHTADDRAITIGDFARQLGASPAVVLVAARRLIASGQAAPAMVSVHGVPTLRGLLPIRPTTNSPIA